MANEKNIADGKRFVVLNEEDSVLVGAESSQGEAAKCARGLAGENPGKRFVVYKKIGEAILNPTVTWTDVQ